MEQYFRGKTALVTGAGWGIGAAIAMLYAACGAKVIVSDTSRKGGKETVAKIKSQKGNATYIRADVSNATECEKLIKRTIWKYGSIDIACNNSAIFRESMQPAKKATVAPENYSELNLSGLNNCMQFEIEAMQRQGGGIIVNTLSVVGAANSGSISSYVNAKYGITALLQNTYVEYPGSGIHINTIPPSFIITALLRDMIPQKMEGGVQLSHIERPGMIQEVAGLILWLSTDETYLLPNVFTGTN